MFSRKNIRSFLLVVCLLAVTLTCSGSVFNRHNTISDNDTATLYGPVTAISAKQTIDRITYLQDKSNDPIYLFIDSPGGEVFEGTKIIDAIMSSKRPIYTVDVGMAASMAAFIHSYGQKRYMLPHSTLMFHNASGGYEGEISKVKSRLAYLLTVMLELNQNVSKRSGISVDELQNKEETEWWILPDEAKQRHLIDDTITILVPTTGK